MCLKHDKTIAYLRLLLIKGWCCERYRRRKKEISGKITIRRDCTDKTSQHEKGSSLPNAKNVCVITPTGGLIVRLNLAVYTTGCLTEN